MILRPGLAAVVVGTLLRPFTMTQWWQARTPAPAPLFLGVPYVSTPALLW
jgi:hypothetical protein